MLPALYSKKAFGFNSFNYSNFFNSLINILLPFRQKILSLQQTTRCGYGLLLQRRWRRVIRIKYKQVSDYEDFCRRNELYPAQ